MTNLLPLNLLQHLSCPKCLREERETDLLLEEKAVVCSYCSALYPLKEGVIIFEELKQDKKSERLEKVYSAFWEKGNDLFLEQDYNEQNQLLKEWKGYFDNETILDAACGNGRFAKEWVDAKAQGIIFFDISDSIFLCQKQFQQKYPDTPALFLKASLLEIPLKSKSIGFTWCSGTVGLLHDQEVPTKELARITKKNLILGVLTDQTMAGKIYIGLNIIKPIINRINNLNILFKLCGIMAYLMVLSFRVLYFLRLNLSFLPRKSLEKILQDKNNIRRIQCSLFDPMIIPKVIKKSDSFYTEHAKSMNQLMVETKRDYLCDYYLFEEKNIN